MHSAPLFIKKRQRHNATPLHEANFAKLARVVPGLRNLQDHLCVRGPDNSQLELRVLETSKYTTTFSLHLSHDRNQPLLSSMQMKIRNYYDASVTEVLAFQKHHRLHARYKYPNSQMYQSDEKWQTNRFLEEWLDHCLRTRCIFHSNTGLMDA